MKLRKQAVTIGFIIFFVLASIGMGVGIYLIYQQWDENQAKIPEAVKKLTTKDADIASVQKDINTLKTLVGCPESMRRDYVFDIIDKDMEKYAGPTSGLELEDADKVYAKIIAKMFSKIQEQKATLSQRQAELEKLKVVNLSREQSKDKELVSIIESSKKDQQTLLAAIDSSSAQRDKINKAKEEIYAELDKLFKDNEEQFVEANNKIAKANESIKELDVIREDLQRVAKAKKSKSISRPDGLILSYNPMTKVAVINLGSGNNLRNQQTFDIYPANATTSTTKPKGTLQVFQVNFNQALCYADEFSTSDPITMGDKIFTKGWTPGDHVRYALCGNLDVTGDGKNDIDRVLTYIQQHGDVCDAYLDGTTMHGKIVAETQFYVVGTPPDPEKNPKEAAAFKEFVSQAKRYSIPDITLQDLMSRLETRELSKVKSGAQPQNSQPSYGVTRSKDNTFRSRTGNRVMPR